MHNAEIMSSLFVGVSRILAPRGFFFGTMTDSGQLWTFAQKEIEHREILRAKEVAAINSDLALLSVGSAMAPPRGSIYLQKRLFNLLFPEGETFETFGSRYRIDFPFDEDGGEEQIETSLVHTASLVRAARQNNFACLDIENYVDFWEAQRKHFHRVCERLRVLHSVPSAAPSPESEPAPTTSGRRPFDKDEIDAISLFSTFVFVKCDSD